MLKLETTSYDYTVDGIINLIEEGQIVLEILPTKALWNTEKASVLIESLLMTDVTHTRNVFHHDFEGYLEKSRKINGLLNIAIIVTP